MNYYPNYNQYYNQQMQQQIPKMQPMEQSYPQYAQPTPQIYKQPIGLQGKSVDSVDVVKAMDIPLDGSISYFPLTDGSAIVSKQLLPDGSSQTIVYKPTEEKENKDIPKYITTSEFDERIKKFDNSNLKDEIKNIKRQLKDLSEDIRDVNEELKNRKD